MTMESSNTVSNAASSAPYSRLESLHTELLELVCSHLARMSDLTHTRFRCMNQDLPIVCDTPGRDDLKALRLVSRRFATLHTPCEGLFRDFHLLITEESLARLEGVASHPRLRTYVSRITFFQPLFCHSHTDYREFQRSLQFQPNYDFPNPLRAEGRDHSFTRLLTDSRPRYIQPCHTMEAWIAYCRLYDKQQRLLKDHRFIDRVAKSLSACRRITAAFIPLRDPHKSPHYFDVPDLDTGSCAVRRDWMTKHHPEVLQQLNLFEWRDTGKEMKERARRHFSWATSILAQTSLQLEELVTDDHQGFGPTFSWSNLIGPIHSSALMNILAPTLNVSQLRRLHLTPLTEDGALSDQDWSHCLTPLLKETPNLLELSLNFGSMRAEDYDPVVDGEKRPRPPTLTDLFTMQFPRLRELHLEWLRFPGKDMARFLASLPVLHTLTLSSISVEDGAWKDVFDAIKSHPTLKDVEVCDLQPSFDYEPNKVCVSSALFAMEKIERSEEMTDLNHYVIGDGCWTAALTKAWKGK